MIGQRVFDWGVHGTWADYFVAPALAFFPCPTRSLMSPVRS